MDMGPTVTNDTAHERFVLEQDGHLAELVYRQDGNRLVLVHTGVPEELAGQGIAGALVSAAVEHARAAGWTVVPWCAYARHWLEKHTDVAAKIDIDWTPHA